MEAPHAASPLVPIISVTPHSPAGKNYPVLDDNLQHLHEIQESIQQMRDVTAQNLSTQILRLSEQYARLSASCPSLNAPGSDPDLVTSANTSPTHAPHPAASLIAPGLSHLLGHKRGSADWQVRGTLDVDTTRRRSWAALEDLTNGKESRKPSDRQRSWCSSISLSSLESENDDPFSSSTANLLGGEKRRGSARSGRTGRTTGTSSTHSLNEADLQNDIRELLAKREAECRLLQARLPLQKSVSTPSILAAQLAVGGPLPAEPPNNTSHLPVGRPSGTESETEEEVLAALLDQQRADSLHQLLRHTVYDDSSEKRRKRGSLFFRKKKDKSKKPAHQWVSACYGSSQICDWCSKPLTNKPALYCENCMVTVHQNSCKEHILECNKPKVTKNAQKSTSQSKAVNKRGSGQSQNHCSSPSRRTTLCYSPWRRVATKLGVNQIINEDKEDSHHHPHHDPVNYPDDVPLVPLEFLDESPISASDLDTDPFLGLQDEEPDSWTPTVGKEITKKLKDKEIKRQEHIYEFILTEKHHCLTLRVMQKVFVDGLNKYFQLGANVGRMFPRLADLTDIHLRFLQRLRARQRQSPVVECLGDVLLEQFSGHEAVRLKAAYGEFCSRHRDAVDIYKYYLSHDRRFQEFVKHCQMNPLLKKKGIPECILFVTQRLTKYPLLIEPLIKTSKENKLEQEKLSKALALVKEILVEVDAQVAEKEKEDRKLEIYNRIDAKSFTTHRNTKFKKSDILSDNRRLRFEGVATLMQGRGKMQVVLVIVLSDVLFFLLENNQKYAFFTPDNKAGVVSLQKLLVREKAGQESRGIYLISSNPAEPEMFELKVQNPRNKQAWIQAIRCAVQNCPEDEDDTSALSSEERQRMIETKQNQIRQLVAMLRQKDEEQAMILEEKMALQLKLVAAAGVAAPLEPPSYCHLVTDQTDLGQMWREVLTAVRKVNQLASSLYASGTSLSRSVSSVGEHQSETYVSPTLPKRAETFGGFDNANKDPGVLNKGLMKKQHQQQLLQLQQLQQQQTQQLQSQLQLQAQQLQAQQLQAQAQSSREPSVSNSPVLTPDTGKDSPKLSLALQEPWLGYNSDLPALLSLGHEQQLVALQLSHHVFTLSCIISQQMTTIDSLQAQLAACKAQLTGEDGRERRQPYRHNQQLEELRNLQARLTQEKEAWHRDREAEERDLEERREQVTRLQEQVRSEQADVTQQREQLYRRLELLTSQGILISPNMPVVTTPPPFPPTGTDDPPIFDSEPLVLPVCSPTDPPRRKADTAKWKQLHKDKASTLPLNLISATNQQKVSPNVQIKQQLPLKLANRLGGLGGSGGGSGAGPQQMLPLKLSSTMGAGTGERRSPAGGYQRLGSPPADTAPAHTHTRTGSSPAMMQNIQAGEGRSGNKAGRTNTYPKLPEKFRVRSPDTQPPPSEEEVIFF